MKPPKLLNVQAESFMQIIFLKDFIYLFMTNIEREAETQAEGEAGPKQEAQCGT